MLTNRMQETDSAADGLEEFQNEKLKSPNRIVKINIQ